MYTPSDSEIEQETEAMDRIIDEKKRKKEKIQKDKIKDEYFCRRCKIGDKSVYALCVFCEWSGDPNEEPSLFSETEPEDWRKFAEIHDPSPEDVGLSD